MILIGIFLSALCWNQTQTKQKQKNWWSGLLDGSWELRKTLCRSHCFLQHFLEYLRELQAKQCCLKRKWNGKSAEKWFALSLFSGNLSAQDEKLLMWFFFQHREENAERSIIGNGILCYRKWLYSYPIYAIRTF